ncbi:MAG: hypothetical protein ABI537_13160 [Casimicrobiaceae bacterium]
MTERAPASVVGHRQALLGPALAIVGVLGFSFKAILVKLAYASAPVDAVTLLALRMIYAAPMFVVMAWWASRDAAAKPMFVVTQFLVTRPLSALNVPLRIHLLALAMAMAVLSTVLPTYLIAEAIKRIGADRTSLVGSLGRYSRLPWVTGFSLSRYSGSNSPARRWSFAE